MRPTLRFGNRIVETARYGGMQTRHMGTDQAEVRILLKSVPAGPHGPALPRDYITIRGKEAIDLAVAEINDALEPDEPDWIWNGMGNSDLPMRRQ